jgi:hypothetical protein
MSTAPKNRHYAVCVESLAQILNVLADYMI